MWDVLDVVVDVRVNENNNTEVCDINEIALNCVHADLLCHVQHH